VVLGCLHGQLSVSEVGDYRQRVFSSFSEVEVILPARLAW
jgi:hypothetical protein